MPKKKNKSKATGKSGSSQQEGQHRSSSQSHHRSSSAHPSSSDHHASSASLRLSRDRREAVDSSHHHASSASLRLTGESRASADRGHASGGRRSGSAAAAAASASASGDRRSASRHSSDRRSADRRAAAEQQLASSMGTLSLTRGSPSSSSSVQPAMKRPGFGRAGQEIILKSNFFRMRIPTDMRVYVHAVMIKRKIYFVERHGKIERARKTAPGVQQGWVDVSKDEPIFYNRNVFDAFLRAEGARLRSTLSYDGRSIAYSAKKLDLQNLNTDIPLVVSDEGKAISHTAADTISRETVYIHVQSSSAVLNYADYFDKDQRGLNREPFQAALDVALATGPGRTHVMVGRSFYSPRGEEALGHPRSATAMAWRGFYQSVRHTLDGLMVNFDQSFTAFWARGGKPLIELVYDANEGREPSCRDARALRSLSQKLKLLKIRARHTGMTFKLHGFADRGADDQRFECDGRMVSVSEYFYDKYRITLRHPRYPLVKVKRDTYVPLEMLDVVEKQRMTGLLMPEQTRTIVKVASTRPQARMDAAKNKMAELLRMDEPVRDSFKMDIDSQLVRLKGRVLPTPEIGYNAKAQPARPSGGQWFQKGGFLLASKLQSWIILNNSNAYGNEIEEFLRDFRKAGQRAGVAMEKPHQIVEVGREGVGSLMHNVFHHFKGKEGHSSLQLMMIVNDRQDTAVYNEIKRIGDLQYGVITQVLLAKNITNPRRRDMYCDNVMLKVNTKLGGRNAIVQPFEKLRLPGMKDPAFLKRPHIVLGADVTHPMPGGKTCSVAALVGSRDKEGVQFAASLRNQPARVEIIQDLGSMFMNVYQAWFKNFAGKVHTDAIIMFRDGVADGQYEQVLSKELKSLRKACEEIEERTKMLFRPRITYIIVTKRHHARFLAEDKKFQDRSGNIPPGTVVDHTVTSADYYEFYLNSHAGIQGTSKPSKYVVLLDENNMGVDELQGYVFRLSHGFARCNRSVSMVNSAYYAHLLAFRGRAYLNEDSDGGSSQTHGSEVERSAVIPPHLQNKLYFV